MTKIRLIALDVDGTLVKKGGFAPTRAVRDALKQAQKQGMLVALASGRARHALDPTVLKGVKPDYFICANGAQVLDAAGRQLAAHTMEPEEMYALVDWCEDYDYPVGFSFSDGYYAYTEYAALREFYGRGTGHPEQCWTARTRCAIWKVCPLRPSAICRRREWPVLRQNTGIWACASCLMRRITTM